LAITSVPFAFVGGAIVLPDEAYRILIAVILALAAYRLFVIEHSEVARPMPIAVALIVGALVGFVSGVTGVGGGIFLTPMVIFAGWATPRMAVAISSACILVNSLAGVLG